MKALSKLSQTVLFLTAAVFGSAVAVMCCMVSDNDLLCLAVGCLAWIGFYLILRWCFKGLNNEPPA